MPLPSAPDAPHRVSAIRAAMPGGGMFRDKDWIVSPKPFPISGELLGKIDALGPALLAFQRACNQIYQQSVSGEAPAWIAGLLDQGKPASLVALGRHPSWRDSLPSVIRPDLILTERGVSIAELDSIPGGIGVTGWLGKTHGSLGDSVIGGPSGMMEGFSKAFPSHDILISRESADYEPEMSWLAGQLNETEGGNRRVLHPWNVTPKELEGLSLYRFFELFDLEQVERSSEMMAMAERGELRFTPSLKPYLEEKLWLALFWMPGLQGIWEAVLSTEHMALLRECIPFGWVLDPAPLPIHAEYPGLGIQSWQEMKRFGGRDRELVIKISGFSEKAWGSRGVHIGHDLSQEEWGSALDEALGDFAEHPSILQRFARARVVNQPVWDETHQAVVNMQGRVRLCPYYFVVNETPQLGGILATVVPADKKILHGMRDATLTACTVV